MKESDARNMQCAQCAKEVGASGLLMFWTVKIERHALNMGAVQRQSGLAMMLGGSAQL